MSLGAPHRKTTNRTDTQSNIVPIPGRDKTYQHCNNHGVPPKMQVHFNKCLPPRMQGPFLYYFNPTTPQWSGIGWWDLSKALWHFDNLSKSLRGTNALVQGYFSCSR